MSRSIIEEMIPLQEELTNTQFRILCAINRQEQIEQKKVEHRLWFYKSKDRSKYSVAGNEKARIRNIKELTKSAERLIKQKK